MEPQFGFRKVTKFSLRVSQVYDPWTWHNFRTSKMRFLIHMPNVEMTLGSAFFVLVLSTYYASGHNSVPFKRASLAVYSFWALSTQRESILGDPIKQSK